MGVKLGEMIASMAGVTNVVQEDGQIGPKCNFVRTHTARRSAATNLGIVGCNWILSPNLEEKSGHFAVEFVSDGLDVAMVVADYKFIR